MRTSLDATIQEELIQKAYDSKCSNSKRDDAERSVAAQLYRADYVYQRLREQFPDLPRLDLKLDRGPRIQTEQCKALPDKVRVMLARLLLRLLPTPYGGQALAAAFMLFCGLRTSEAAGVVYGDIRRSGAFGSLFVCRREQNGEFVNTLKTKNAYRNVVLPKILMDFIDVRIDRLKNLGFSDDQISKLPIACASGNPETLTRANAVSALVRELLQLCGISDEFLQAMQDLADCEPDIVDDDERVTDVAAYTLRRDWCTRACHVCGFAMDQVDYLLGHAPKSNRRQDYLTPEQKKGYRMRGRISVISQSSGRVLKRIGSARRKLTEKWNDDHPGEKMEGKALERQRVRSFQAPSPLSIFNSLSDTTG